MQSYKDIFTLIFYSIYRSGLRLEGQAVAKTKTKKSYFTSLGGSSRVLDEHEPKYYFRHMNAAKVETFGWNRTKILNKKKIRCNGGLNVFQSEIISKKPHEISVHEQQNMKDINGVKKIELQVLKESAKFNPCPISAAIEIENRLKKHKLETLICTRACICQRLSYYWFDGVEGNKGSVQTGKDVENLPKAMVKFLWQFNYNC